jgi:hypothetical protein
LGGGELRSRLTLFGRDVASLRLRVAIPLHFVQTGRRFAPVASCDPASLRSDGTSLRSGCELRSRFTSFRRDVASLRLRAAIPLHFVQTGRRFAPVASCDPASLRSDGTSLRSGCELRSRFTSFRRDVASLRLRAAIPLHFVQTGRRFAPVASCELRVASLVPERSRRASCEQARPSPYLAAAAI